MKRIFGVILVMALMAFTDALYPDLQGTLEQEVAFHPEEGPQAEIDVLLVSENNSYPLIVYYRNGKDLKQVLNLPNFWKGGAIYSGHGAYPATIKLSAIDNGFEVAVRDLSADKVNLDLQFLWEHGRFRLIDERKSASPRIKVNALNYSPVEGRWQCSIETNYLNGLVTTKSPKGLKRFQKGLKRQYLDDYVISSEFMDDLCL